jgi:hypothetical protein
MSNELERQVRSRAGDRCEYCHLPQSISLIRHPIDHVIAQQHHGRTTPENLALSCAFCNRHKGPNIAGVDPDTAAVIPLYNPRNQVWDEHFVWNGVILIGRTPTGRATVDVLAINEPSNLRLRVQLAEEGIFPY